MTRGGSGCWLVVAALLLGGSGGALAKTWSGPAGGDWFVDTNWVPNGIPSFGEDVSITNGSVLLTNATSELASFVLTNATLTFTNWATCLTASNVAIWGTVQHTRNSATGTVVGVWVPDARIWIVCTNFQLYANGKLDGDTRGFMGGEEHVAGRGPGGTAPSVNSSTSGGGHGGAGGTGWNGGASATYGNLTAPDMPGSGSGGDHVAGRHGGGLVTLEVRDQCTVNGVITVNGEDSSNNRNGGGSGGGIHIQCRTLDGQGVIRADGGKADGNYGGGGGGGGRVAVIFDPAEQSNATPATIRFGAAQGVNTINNPGRPGTLYFPDSTVLTPNGLLGGQVVIPGFTAWFPVSLTISNGLVTFPDGFDLRVTNDVQISGLGGGLEITNSARFEAGGNVVLTNYGSLHVYSVTTNGAGTDYGTLVTVTGNVIVASNAAVYPYSNPTNGGSVLFRMSNLTIQAGGRIDADAKGWAGGAITSQDGYGPGGGEKNYSGGGYGGAGSGARSGYAGTYGSATAPIHPGSGGGGAGGRGGGLVRMEVADTAVIAGTISANGGTATYGGSGGGVYLQARVFGLAYGTVQAAGGTGSSKGGGGGRIALGYQLADSFDGTLSVAAGGSGANTGAVGTISRAVQPGYLTMVVRGEPVRHEVASPYDYGTYGILQGTVITNSIPLIAEQNSTSRYICMGWMVTNSIGAIGDDGTQAVFTVTTNLVLSWVWTNQYFLSSSANTNGALTVDRTGWYTNGVPVSMTAVPDAGHVFIRWSGAGLPLTNATDNPLTVTMSRSRTLQANFASSTQVSRAWTGTGNWLSATNWSPMGLPGLTDPVTIRLGSCTLADPMTVGAVAVSNGATLMFSGTGYYGTNLELVVGGDVEVRGTITHAANSATSTNGAGQWVPDNWLHIRAANVTIATNGKIDGNAKGFVGPPSQAENPPEFRYTAGRGPGRSLSCVNASTGGAGYGGRGGNGLGSMGGSTYGNSNAPAMPGSSSGADHGGGQSGGGLVRLEVGRRLTVEGTITVNGENSSGNRDGGGSGGGVWATCRVLTGIGTISARGGNGDPAYAGGPGGGGRIAVWGVRHVEPYVTFTAAAGAQNLGPGPADPGTVVWWPLIDPGTVFLVR